MIDNAGFRLNVGIILANQAGQILFARRINPQNAWQFPQGGLLENEEPENAMYRELKEELGLSPEDVKLLAESKRWLSYRLPKRFIRYDSKPLCIGQKQKWFLLQLLCEDARICLDFSEKPEFNEWKWVDYWYPEEQVIAFKRAVYRQALVEFESFVKALSVKNNE